MPDDRVTSDLLKEARQRFKRCAEAEDKARKRMVAAKAFRAGDQWPDEIKIQRQGGAAIQGQAAQPPRPCLTIDRLSQPVRQVSNAIRAANFGITVLPNGHGADDDTAEIFKGIIRRIQNESRGESPVEWAGDNAAECGLGWFRLRTDYIPVPEGYVGPELKDQDIRFERIPNALSVYCDPSATRPTKSDARYMFVTSEVDKDEAKRLYGLTDDDLKGIDDFMATGDEDSKGWAKEHTIRVAEYWRVESQKQTFVQLADGSFVLEDAAPKDAEVLWSRTVDRPVVMMSTICATKEVQKFTWVGSKIPLIPVLGEELNIDGQPMVRGIIEEGMDGQRMVNYMYSAAIETVALAPKAPLIVADDQIADYKTIWQQANRFNYAYLPYKPTTVAGLQVPPPVRDNTEPAIQAMAFMLDKSEEAIKATTGIFDPSLGNTNPREKSGRAILALQKQSELGQSNFLDNVQRALVYAGEQLVEIIPKVYDRPGRILQILGMDDAPKQVMVGQPYVEQKGVPVPVPQGHEQQMAEGMAKFYDLSKGRYAVTVAVGKSYTTQREEGAAILGDIIQAKPELIQVMGDLWAADLDMPHAQELSERLKKMLPPQLQEQKQGEPNVQQLQQQLAQAGQMVQQLSAELNAKNQLIETDQIKAQGQLQQKQLAEQAENEREMARLVAEKQLTDAKLALEYRKLEAQIEIEMAKIGNAQMLARAKQETQLLHAHTEAQVRETEVGADRAAADLDRAASQQEADKGRDFQREEGAQSRAFEADQAERATQRPTL